MPLPRRRPSARRAAWAVPAVAAVAVASAVVLPSTLASAGPPRLPERTAADLLASLAGSSATPLEGTVVQTARLGLPELPAGSSGTTPLAMLTGSHTLRVWSDGPERVRLALLGELAEYDVVRDGRDAWTYSSEQDEAVHHLLPAGREHARGTGPVAPPTPQDAAKSVLEAVEPTTAVRVDTMARVAGRDAYQLVVEPRDPGSLVGSVRLAVDAATSVPLRVQVWSVQDAQEPALEVGFTEVSFDRPDATVFDFVAPADAQVREVVVPGHEGGHDGRPGAERGGRPSGDSPAEVTGEGWARVVELPGAGGTPDGEAAGALDSLTTRVPEGRLLQTALLTGLLTDDGRLLVGAVPADRLRESARG